LVGRGGEFRPKRQAYQFLENKEAEKSGEFDAAAMGGKEL